MAKLIEDYGLIGDGETVALIDRSGSIDWLCWPRFDSDACFSALIGTEAHGRWMLAPTEPAQTTRRYQPDTLILETEFETREGRVLLTDFMPIREDASLIIRRVSGLGGRVRMRSTVDLKFDYGSMPPWIELDGTAALARVGPDLVVLRAPVELDLADGVLSAEVELRAGDTCQFMLAYGDAAKAPPAPVDPEQALAATQRYWRDWIGRFDKPTAWADAVKRSLITLKAMISRTTGGIVAAPTTSLPEAPGGEMNWDYRFCWLRDATFTLSALLNAGYRDEAAAWRDWLLRAVAGAPEKMRIMYRLDGSRRLEEWLPPWLPGFRWATPVRIGNAASSQRQLDVYGEVIDALQLAAKAGMPPSNQSLNLQEAIVRHVEAVWQQPDQGLWEVRGRPRHHVYSKVSAWVAIDRWVRSPATVQHADPDRLRQVTDLGRRMHAEICRHGFDAGLGRFVSYYGGHELDASLLLLPMVGFLPADDPRMAATIAAIEGELIEDGLVRRWPAHGENAEGAFLACTCWLAECQAMQGRREAALKSFERFLSVRNDLGLLAEEYNVRGRHLAGNFPQALSHLALVETALALCGPVMKRGRDA
jgi:GH15 family glucan-1,4-alpha-glucosidase